MAHTPGPWIFCTPNYNAQCRRGEEHLVMTADGKKAICHVFIRKLVRGEMHQMPVIDNGNLIAAAPDLLEACKAALDDYNGSDSAYSQLQVIAMLRAAIAKAEGR